MKEAQKTETGFGERRCKSIEMKDSDLKQC